MNLSQLNRILLQTLLLPVVALLLLSGLLVWQIDNAERTVSRIQTADRNIATANLLLALTVDEESGVRGYQNTGNEIFLQPYELATLPLESAIARLRRGIVAQHLDPTLLDQFLAANQLWVNNVARPMIALTRAGGNTRDPAINLRAKADMDNIRAIMAAINAQQNTLRQREVDRWHQQVRETLEAVIGLAAVIGLMIGVFARSRLHSVSAAYQTALDGERTNAQATYQSEQRLRTTLTSIGDGVIVCDQEGRVEMLNAIGEQLTGWKQAEAYRQPIGEVFRVLHEATREPVEDPVHAVRRAQGPIALASSALLIGRGGAEIYIEESGAPIHDRSGALSGVVIVFRDVTEQRRAQAALLTSEKLAVAGRLAATLAHEIHNPLDSVVNLLYLMKGESSPEESRHFLELASSELDRVTQISRAMLGMYRESRTPIALNVQEMLESVLLLLERQIRQAGLTLHRDLAPDTIVSGYPAELRQVFSNLLANAIDACTRGCSLAVSAHGMPATRIGRSQEFRPAGVQVSIADNGCGIAPEALEQLFRPFFTTKGEKGTGLGLWVSQGIIQKHGGEIHIDSTTDPERHGTIITLFLPRGSAVFAPGPSGPREQALTAPK